MAEAMPVAAPAISTTGGQALPLLTRMEMAHPGINVARDGWTPQALAALDDIWAAGLPSAGIARVLGTSKNAVIGQAHRRNLPPRPSPLGIGRTPVANRAPRRWAARPVGVPAKHSAAALVEARARSLPAAQLLRVAAPAPVEAEAAPVLVVLERKPGSCCWPMWGDRVRRGDPGYGRYCGAEAPGGHSYCPAHTASSKRRQWVAAV